MDVFLPLSVLLGDVIAGPASLPTHRKKNSLGLFENKEYGVILSKDM